MNLAAPALGNVGTMVWRPSRFTWGLLCVSLLGLGVRLLYALPKGPPPYLSDATYFLQQSALIGSGRGFADPFIWMEQREVVATAFHPPLYSVFLAGASFIGGSSDTTGRVASSLLGVGMIVCVGLIGRMVAGDLAGLAGAFIAAISPNLWVLDGQLMSEGLGAFLVAFTLLFAYRLLRSPTGGNAIGLGLGLGLAALTRPETLALAAFLVIPLVLFLAEPMRRRIGLLAIALAVMAAVLAPWLVRNMTTFDRPVLFSNNGEAVIGYANCRATYYGPNAGNWGLGCPFINGEEGIGPVSGDNGSEASRAARQRAQGFNFLKKQKQQFVTVVVWARLGRTFSLYQPFSEIDAIANEGKSVAVNRAGVFTFWATSVAAIAGIFAIRRSRRYPAWPLLTPLVVSVVVSVYAYGTPRFRAISEPSLAVLAGAGVSLVWSVIVQRRMRRAESPVIVSPEA